MSTTKLLHVQARSADRVVVCGSVRRCVGIGLSVSLYLSISASVALSVGAAQAAIPSLPPLPAAMPLDDALASSEGTYNAPPLPRDAVAETPNPFRDDSSDEPKASRAAVPASRSS